MKTDRILLLILDGWGIAPAWGGNAITQAKPEFYQTIWRTYPHAELEASGTHVGLLPTIRGNSEVGHLNIGAGRTVLEGYTLINERINEQPLPQNPALNTAIANAKQKKRPLHLMGLFSNGAIHSHLDHIFDLIDMANDQHMPEILLHLFSDGRDTDPKSAIEFFGRLKRKLLRMDNVRVASLIGRWWAMDRDGRWDRTKKAYDALIEGVGEYAKTPEQVITESYRRGITDEFISPTVIYGPNGSPKPTDPIVKASRIQSGDSVIFFNFRPDRARQITQAIVLGKLGYETVPNHPTGLTFITFIPYQAGLPVLPAFAPDIVAEPLALAIASAKKRQLHIAETEKYAHITYFLNGGHEQPMPGEDRILIPSPKVATYNTVPAMSTPKIAKETISKLKTTRYHFIVVNFANPDMVGHTGMFEASLQAVLTVDEALQNIIPIAQSKNYTTIVTADHGNVEEMVNPSTGEPDTGHTRNRVPFILIPPDLNKTPVHLKPQGRLADVAPTILTLMGLTIPKAMVGETLVI